MILVLLAIVGAVSIFSVTKISKNATYVRETASRAASFLVDIEQMLKSISTNISASIDTSTLEGMNNAKQAKTELDDKWKEMEIVFAKDEETRNKLNELKVKAEKNIEHGEGVYIATIMQEWTDIAPLTKEYSLSRQEVTTIIAEMKTEGRQRLDDSLTQIERLSRTTMTVTSVIILIAFMLGIGLAYSIGAIIANPIQKLKVRASAIASGELIEKVEVESSDETGELSRAMNHMVRDLKNMIGNVRTATMSVDKASWNVKEVSTKITNGSQEQSQAIEDAASSIEEMHSSLKEIGSSIGEIDIHSSETASSVLEMSTSVEQVAQMMKELSASIEDTSSAIAQMSVAARSIAESVETLSSASEQTAASASEMSATVYEVEQNAKESAELAAGVLDDAEKLGMPAIDKTIKAMSRIEEASKKTAEAVEQLREKSQNIGKIVTVINNITDQTGLLALNASILASKAGVHGKGFAVVASEMRELANRTAYSTQEITDLISKVQEETLGTVQMIKDGTSEISDGVRLSREAGDALKKILERASRSREMSWSISHATDEQAKTVGQVKQAIEKINEMSHQIMKAAKEQQSGSEQITVAAEKMREITQIVSTATSEHAKGSKDITAGVENMNTKIGMVNRAAAEVQTECDLIVKSIERIKGIAQMNTVLSDGLSGTVVELAGQSDALSREIKRFKTDEDSKELNG